MTLPKSSSSLLLSIVVLTLHACSSGSSSDAPLSASPPDEVNQPPTVSGMPPTMAMQDRAYSFIPSANDPDGDSLSFSVSNMPAWASFDAQTGALSGTPASQHLGIYADIMISVSDGQNTVTLQQFDIEVVATAAGSLSLSWTPPTKSADGTPLNDLAGYRVRWGTQSGNYLNLEEIENPGISNFVVERLVPGVYFLVVTAVDTSDNESAASNEVNGAVQ